MKPNFWHSAPPAKNDNTSEIESRIQRRLLLLHQNDLFPTNLCKLFQPTGSQRQHMYGLPKTHKKDVPLGPGWFNATPAGLISLFSNQLSLYSSNCIQDSFIFADIIKTLKLYAFFVFLSAFDISKLFTNVPLAETIQISADAP